MRNTLVSTLNSCFTSPKLAKVNKKLILFLSLGLSLQAMAQAPKAAPAPAKAQQVPENMTVIKPYFTLADTRTLQFQGEVTYYVNDTAVNTLKAKWDGSMEVVAADGKLASVSILEAVVENKITYNDLLADIEAGREVTEYVVSMDKAGKLIDVVNLVEVQGTYIQDKERDLKAEGKKMDKEEKQAMVDSLKNSLAKNDMLKKSIFAYARNFVGMYGKMIPTNGDTIKDMVAMDSRRYFASATKSVDANQKLWLSDVKGPKFNINEVIEYDYPAMVDFLVNIKSKDPVFEENTHVKNTYITAYDNKVGWPLKINEELVVTNGKYKVVYKWAVKLNKDK